VCARVLVIYRPSVNTRSVSVNTERGGPVQGILYVRGDLGIRRALFTRAQVLGPLCTIDDSKAILKCIFSRKQKAACSCTPLTTGAAYTASGAWRA